MSIGTDDATVIQGWNDGLEGTVTIRFLHSEDERSREFASFCDTLVRYAPRLRIEEQKSGTDLPSLLVSDRWRYHAVPEGRELKPFLQLLSMLDKGKSDMAESLSESLKQVTWPADFRIYVTTQCPHCPQALRQLLPLPFHNSLLRMTIIDGFLFPEMAGQDGVRSVPTIILDNSFRWTGTINLREVVEALINRDPARLSAKTLEGMVKEGNAERLAAMMLDRKSVFPAFPDLATHPEWSVRMGAMVVVEEISDQDPDLAMKLELPLLERLETSTDPIRGDIVYLLGMVGSEESLKKLGRIQSEQEENEFREILEEAQERLRRRLNVDSRS